ncbi:MAG TPA: FAD-dependent monooxygenase [Burkholderiales bacterium]|nr:FAD-dependent monooxygenase [Burkholderiales bacterium]
MAEKTFQPDRMAGYTLPVYETRTPPEIARGEKTVYPVIVVGAGLGGLTAALELGARGVHTVLLDEDNTVGAAGLSSRGICYAKRSLEIFDRFGVAERVRAKGVTWNEGDVFAGEERLYRFNLQPERDQKYPAFVNLQQFYVEQYLVERIMQTPAVDLRWKNKVVDVRPGADGVEVEVECPDGRYRARCQWLVGADGAHSVVRDKLGAKDAESALSEDQWCITDIRMSPSAEVVRKAYLDNPLNAGGAIWYHQMADGIWRTDWQVSQYDDPALETEPAQVTERLKKLLGPDTPFELVWVGPWRFRRRFLEHMRHGRVLFLGDAAAQHSPFGARGGNRAIQDADNLAWKLALVLEGKAHPDLMQTYDSERGFAARENVEHSSRSATFIGPQSHGERLVRDAILDLARADPAMRALVNVGRLSIATTYAESPLNMEKGEPIDAPLAAPGAAAPDGRFGDGYFVARLQGQFSIAWFGGDGPAPRGAQAIAVPRAGNEALFERYGVPPEGATYVIRPDGHVLARCRGIDPAFAQAAIDGVLGYREGAPPRVGPPVKGGLSPLESDRLYDAFAALLDGTPAEGRERALARLAVLLAGRLGDYAAVIEAIDAAAHSARMPAPSGRRDKK